MLPKRKEAEKELILAGKLNPGPWEEHARNVGKAAEYIASRCSNLDSNKAYILGILHDIGRRIGIVSIKHVIAGYEYAIEKGWDEVSRICMTHSYPIQDITTDIGKLDVSEMEYNRIDNFLKTTSYDDYDKLIILCDALALAQGFCLLEKRFIDTTRRYGVFPFTVDRWNATFEIKEYFEKQMSCSIYDVLPNVKETTFIDTPLWKPSNK